MTELANWEVIKTDDKENSSLAGEKKKNEDSPVWYLQVQLVKTNFIQGLMLTRSQTTHALISSPTTFAACHCGPTQGQSALFSLCQQVHVDVCVHVP